MGGRRGLVLAAAVVSLAGPSSPAHAVGITADAGMTPSFDRWIVRSQLRYSERRGQAGMQRRMGTWMAPVVLAYGVRPKLTVIARQPFMHRRMEMTNSSAEDLGAGDLLLLGKFGLLRVNRPGFVFAAAPTFGVEMPTGDKDFGSQTWDAVSGMYVSCRRGRWGADLNFERRFNGLGARRSSRPGDESSVTLAAAYQFSLDAAATRSLWPVLEVSYSYQRADRTPAGLSADTGGELTMVSPGVKFVRQSFMLELLLQRPVSQWQRGNQLERKLGGIAGVRYLF